MPQLVVHHTVEDYDKWKPVFDGHADFRKESGCKGGRLYRSEDNPNEIVAIWDWDTLENARAFTQSDSLRQAMQNAGVIGRPDLYFVNEVETLPY